MSLTDQAEMHRVRSFAYNQGIDAYQDGALYEQNPYRGTSDLVSLNEWAAGWCDAEQLDSSIYDGADDSD